MLDNETKRRIDSARDILVGKLPNPQSQVEQITIALIYKFMDDMDVQAVEYGGEPSFFIGDYAKYGWRELFAPSLGGHERLALYGEAIVELNRNPNLPQLFRDIFKNAFLPYRDPETLTLFLKTINDFKYDHSERLGDAFEYLLSVLGSQGDAGQFRTPRHIIDFIVDILDPKKNETICDPACGTAGFLISSYKHILENNQRTTPGDLLTPDERNRMMTNFAGYDISPDMVRLSLVNLYLHGFPDPSVIEYDTLTSEERWNENFDVILANPPFMSPKGGIKPHKKFSINANRSEVLFVDYIAEHIHPSHGRAGIIVPEGIIFQSATAYKDLRKMLVDKHYLYAVVSLPAGVFNPYSGVKTSILLMDRTLAQKSDKILFVKITNDGFGLGAQRREQSTSDLPDALNLIRDFQKAVLTGDTSRFDVEDVNTQAVAVEKTKIAENGEYGLSGERYKVGKVRQHKFEMVQLSEICEINPKKSDCKDLPQDSLVSFVPMADLNENQIVFSPKETKELSKVVGSYTYFKDDDVLLAKVTPCFENGKAGIARNLSNGIGFGSSELFVLRADSRVLPNWLYLFVTTDDFRKAGKAQMTGTGGLQRVPREFVKSFKIPLPPLSIQKEIVEKIEGYQRIIDGAKQVVENYKPQIEISPDWPIVELGEVCELNPKKSELQDLSKELDVSFVPMADINENQMHFRATQSKRLSDVFGSYTYFKENDVLLAKVTPCFENGKAGIARNLDNGIGFGSSEYYVLRAGPEILPVWIYLLVTDNRFREIGKARMTGTGGLQRVPKDFVQSYQIPLPTLEVQKEIVARINQEQELVNANKKLIKIFEQKIKTEIAKLWEE